MKKLATFSIGCLYRPNGNPQPEPKFDYKLAWFERKKTAVKKTAPGSGAAAKRSTARPTQSGASSKTGK